VIATAVMDNGVSFHDTALRTMVIFADTKEEFIQMLGRKRTDGKTINLYVCRRDREHFRKRFVAAKEILKIYEQYEKDLARIWGVCENPYNYMSNFLYYNNCNNYNIFFQNRILEDIMKNKRVYSNIRRVCYLVWGTFAVNWFSIQRCRNLKKFYREIMETLENDENAFLILQAQWLGKSMDDIQKIVRETEEERENNHKRLIEEVLMDNLDKELTVDDNKKLKEQLGKSLVFLATKYIKDEANRRNDIKSFNDRAKTLTKEKFNRVMEASDLPYILEKSSQSTFTFHKINN